MGSLLLVIGSLLATAGASDLPGCTITDVRKVPAAAFGGETWAALHQSFRKYGACDRGGEISTSYDEDVMRLLSRHWEDFPAAGPIFKKSPAFLRFVEKHIDATSTAEELQAVAANAQKRCPEGMSKICERLVARVQTALADVARLEAEIAARRRQQ
jgi:hypothetical protein